MIGFLSPPYGGGGCVGMERFGRAGEGFPRGFMRLAHGIPSRAARPNPFNAPDPGGLQRAMPRLADGRAAGLGGGVVAIDGKALRSPPHPVGAFVGGARPVLGQVRVEDRSNGIAAVPVLLGTLAPKARVVTADAMRTQRRTARAVTAAGCDHVPAPKGNRGALYEDVKPYPDDPAQDGNCLVPSGC